MIATTQKQAAEQLGIKASSLREWMKQPGFPDTSGGYDITAIEAWRTTRNKKGSQHDDELQSASLTLKKAQAQGAQLKVAKEAYKLKEVEGELLPRKGWELFAATLLTHLRDAADQLPDLMAGHLCDNCRESVLARLREELERWQDDTATDLAAGPTDQS